MDVLTSEFSLILYHRRVSNDSICYGETYDFVPLKEPIVQSSGPLDSCISSVLNHSVSPLLTTWYTLTTTNDSGGVKTDSIKMSKSKLPIYGLEDLWRLLSFTNLNIEPFHTYSWLIDGPLFLLKMTQF